MASTLIKLTSILVMMNIFIYLGMTFTITAAGEDAEFDIKNHMQNDLLQKLVSDSVQTSAESLKENFTDYDINMSNSGFTTFPALQGGEDVGGSGGVSFLDSVNIVMDFMKLLFNIAVSPITLFTSFRIPFFFGVIIGIPYLIIFVIAVMAMIRGVGD